MANSVFKSFGLFSTVKCEHWISYDLYAVYLWILDAAVAAPNKVNSSQIGRATETHIPTSQKNIFEKVFKPLDKLKIVIVYWIYC